MVVVLDLDGNLNAEVKPDFGLVACRQAGTFGGAVSQDRPLEGPLRRRRRAVGVGVPCSRRMVGWRRRAQVKRAAAHRSPGSFTTGAVPLVVTLLS